MRSIKFIPLLLLLGGLCMAALLAVTAWWTGERMQEQARKVFVAKDVTADILPPPMYLIEVRLALSQAIEGTMSAPDALKNFERLVADYRARVDHWQQHPPYGLETPLLGAQHDAALKFLDAARAQVLEPLSAGAAPSTLHAPLTVVHALYEDHRRGVDATVAESTRFADSNLAGFDAARASAQRWGIGMLALTLAAGILLCLWARHRLESAIAGPLRQACTVAERIAAGDLTNVIEQRGRDEAAELLGTLKRMQQSLRDVVGQVRGGVDSVASASAQIAQGNGDLSRRTEQQASSLQQTAASMHQMTSIVRASADNAQQAHRLAAGASSVAGKGGDAVARVASTMNEIQHASRRIADITGVIDSIAFQTNILALNAAVEAARAGEQGRGFAVVASEVRSLAQRSADAAREIKQLIGTSVERINAGSAQATDAGTTMTDIVTEVRQVSGLIAGIATASQQQTDGIAQVNQSVGEIDQMTQQNAALVEQSAAAAESLREQAKRLADAVSVFRLEPATVS